MENPDDLCPRPPRLPRHSTEPHSPPIFLSSVYECRDPEQADALLSGREQGYVYGRDAHPNADLLAEKCRQLHAAERAAITSSGMAALALVVLSQLEPSDHVVASNQLYGRTLCLLTGEAARLGIASSVVDTCDLAAVEGALTTRSKMVVVETISNPLLRVADLPALAELAHRRGATLLADNTLAGPAISRPLACGADWVMESLTKTMNGHSDVILGLLCGPAKAWQRVPAVLSTWGLASAPFDCWLALRGLGTLGVRMERAAANALAVAQLLIGAKSVERVYYPGLPSHPDYELARRQFGEKFGSIVTFTLRGGGAAARRFMAAASRIPFCPSLGELSTTLSHPESTSHRALTPAARS
ncbi:MAG: aminotransferase class I/II-fold pyridoxal phosphate-dependent enzyme, partial [Planctomycetia bacterium]|nr:aminotransferase class I/II-fold pyridoxal phosphate-dependent enzyme [Planctomycetia bacterium]